MAHGTAGHSAHVEMYLVVGGRRVELGQLGPEHCILARPESLPSSVGEIVFIVDANETRIPAEFLQGASTVSRRVPYTRLAAAATPAAITSS